MPATSTPDPRAMPAFPATALPPLPPQRRVMRPGARLPCAPAMRHMGVMDPLANLRDYFEKSPVALSLAQAEGDYTLTMVNGRFGAVTGYAAAEVIGRNCRVLQQDPRLPVGRNRAARARIHAFLQIDRVANVRCVLVNFRKDGTPFVNLLYMSKLRDLGGQVRFLFGSQFDISRAQPDLLADYDRDLGDALARIGPIVADSGLVVEGSLMSIANSAATIAQARFTLAHLDDAGTA